MSYRDASDTALAGPPVRARLASFLSHALGADVTITGMRPPSSAGGWSNETLIVELGIEVPQRVVLRLRPEGPAMFRDYDLEREYRILQALQGGSTVPVAPVLALDRQGEVLGRPFFVMQYLEGRVPSDDRPSFVEAGWLHDASAEAQRSFYRAMVAAIAGVHAVDWRRLGLGFLARGGGDALAAEIAWLRNLHLWGAGGDLHPLLEQGFAALERRPDRAGSDCLLWGDARPANVLVEQFRPVALLDWEMAGLGPAELDLAWFLEMNRMRSIGAGLAPLPGFAADAETLDLYRAAGGPALGDLAWYRLHAVQKMAVLMERYLRVAMARGVLRPGHRLLRDNVALRRLQELLY